MREPIKIVSASELSRAEKEKLQAALVKKIADGLLFSFEVDESLLGGIRVETEDGVYDATVGGKLAFLNALEQAPEKREPSLKSVGVVLSAADGTVRIKGLPDAKYGELLEVEGDIHALVLSLEEGVIGAIVLDGSQKVGAGSLVRSTGRIMEIKVGSRLLGRIVNALGEPIDGRGKIMADKTRPIEFPAPAIIDRGKVTEPLFTGTMAVDAMIPIGKGQRELIIGDRQTGKTTLAVDTILNQKDKNVLCVYVAIGQKASSVNQIAHTLREYGASEYTVIVAATASDSAALQYAAPFAGAAIAEEFMYAGRDVLIVYDDLSKHAVAYRAMSLLLRRPPGREAYPGDIFYLHSRLLERAAKLSNECGGGSMTALPIVETAAGDISAYIPTNVISITDGQIYLESELFRGGIRPAVNAGLSVSRVGSAAQRGTMKKIGGKLRLDLSQYRELAVFARFGSDLDAATSESLEHGKRLVEVLKQDIHAPLSAAEQTIILYAASSGLFSRVAVSGLRGFIRGFLEFFKTNRLELYQKIALSGEISMDGGLFIEDAVKEFMQEYAAAERN